MKKSWNQHEINFLKSHFNSHGSKFCAYHLQRSRSSIKMKASRLKIINHIWTTKTKVCKGCYQEKEISEFSPHANSPSGRQSKCKKCRAQWESNRKKTDKTYRLLHNIRNRIRIAIKKNIKHSSSVNLLGCSIQELKSYLSQRFLPGMSWENHGLWHIDHIKPCCSFDLSQEEDQKKCFHYTNLQPLWAKDNLSKGRSV